MNNKEKTASHIKSAVILLLLFLTVFLLWESRYYNKAFEYITGIFISTRDSIQASDGSDAESHSSARIYPSAISVCVGAGNRYASMYDSELVREDFHRFSALLGEALGTAAEPEEISPGQWQEALDGESVCFFFNAPTRLDFLSDTLGTGMSGAAAARESELMFLGCRQDGVSLFFMQEGSFFLCDTGVSADTLRARIMETVPNNAHFSHELSRLKDFGGTLLIPENMPEIFRVYSSAVSADQIAQLFTDALGFDSSSEIFYRESGGDRLYEQDHVYFRINSDGSIVFNMELGYLDPEHDEDIYLFRRASDIIDRSLARCCGAADIYPSGAVYGSPKLESMLSFDYSVNGIPVGYGSGEAGYIALVKDNEGGYALSGRLYPRSFEISGERMELLPPVQAAAIAHSQGSDNIGLIYSQSGEGLDCMWVSK